MAATTNTNPPVAGAGAAGVAAAVSGNGQRSPPYRRSSPPWTQIVRADYSASAVGDGGASSPENFGAEGRAEGYEKVTGNAGKEPVRDEKCEGSVESVPVMGDVSWPALSEAAKGSSKLVASDSFKNLGDGSSQSQVIGAASSSSSPLSSPSSSSHKHGSANQSSALNHGRPTRQRSMKRDGGSIALANAGFNSQSSQPGAQAEGSGNVDNAGREHTHNHGPREGGQRGGGDHPQQRNSFRRGNGGPHSRGGSSHQNHGGRRDQDRGNHEWNHQRSFNSRDAPMQPPLVSPRGFQRPALHVPGPFMAPLNPMGMIPDVPPVYYFSGPPVVPAVHAPVFFPPPELELQSKIVNQIDYYFSVQNLIRDTFLRQNMDQQGWVPIALIAGFNRLAQLTDNVQIILDAVRLSSVVEVQGDKIRRCEDWERWVMPPTMQFPNASSSHSPRTPTTPSSTHSPRTPSASLVAHVQSLALDEKTSDHIDSEGRVDANAATSSSGDFNIQSQTKDGIEKTEF